MHVLLIDELTQFTEAMYRFLRNRVRLVGLSLPADMTADRMAERKVWFRPADNARVARLGAMGGWDQLRARLVGDGDGKPMIVCLSTCLDSIRTIPAMQHDQARPEDMDSNLEDHAADEWRYA